MALIIVGIVAVVLVAVVVGVAMFASAKLAPVADQVLVDLRDGKVEAVYAAAAPEFRSATSLEDLRQFVAVRTQALGAYRRIAKSTGGGVEASTSGTVGKLTCTLEYEKGTADGEFQFVKRGDGWALLNMTIKFDETKVPAPDRALLEPRSRELLDLFSRGAFVELYARFSPALRDAWKAADYEPQIRDLHGKTGAVASATLREVKDGPEGKVVAVFDVGFEHGRGDATFGWYAQTGAWILVAFDLHLGPR
jgi:hypothetical protein